MGNSCVPDHERDDANMDMELSEHMTDIINRYQDDIKRMEQELDSLKTKSAETRRAYDDRTKENYELNKELASIKTSMHSKEQSIKRHVLEAALYSSAASILSKESISKKVMEGWLQKSGRSGKVKSKRKYVEIYLISGEASKTQFTEGRLMLVWADCHWSKLSSRGTLIEVKEEAANVNVGLQEQSFSILATVGGVEKELVFTCESKDTKELWVQSCRSGLAQIMEEKKFMNELFTLRIDFHKEILGFRVVETRPKNKELVDKSANEKSDEEVVRNPSLTVEASKPEDESEEAAKAAHVIKGETEQANEQETSAGEIEEKDQTVNTESEKDFNKPGQRTCDLRITDISDEELRSKGLIEQLTIRKINDLTIQGKSFVEQLKILKTTKKPFTLTFTGPNYLKKPQVPNTAYASILKDLVAEGDNDVKSTFYDMVKGSAVEEELKAGEKDGAATIKALISNRGRLITLLQNMKEFK